MSKSRLDITYKKTKEGYLIPNIQSCDPEYDRPIGRYGKLALMHLQETNPVRFSQLFIEGTLEKKMYERNKEIIEKMMLLEEQLLQQNPMPETEDILGRTRHLNQIRLQAEEIVLNEMIYHKI
ncbi:MAG: TnpV protein [Bacillales bacterium]|nr:TnpV protein [Bacillales bacterium]